jgi:phasin family protein
MTTDQNKPTGKPGQRSRKAEQRARKSDQQQGPKPDQPQDAREQIDATLASTETFPMGAGASIENPSIGALVPIGAFSIGAVAPADTFSIGFQTIATAYGAYTRKSFEETGSFIEKLSGVRSLDKAIEIQAEFAKQAYETFLAESQKICELYSEFARQIFRPLQGFLVKATQTAR